MKTKNPPILGAQIIEAYTDGASNDIEAVAMILTSLRHVVSDMDEDDALC